MAALGQALLRLAQHIDADRAQGLQRDWGADTAPLGLLLGCAFPPLTPRHDWQHRALAALGTEGLTVARRREGVLGRLTRAASDLSDADRALSGLRRAVWAERARIALRELLPLELGGASVDVTAKELSHLAEAALEVVLAEASQHVRRRFGTPLKSDGRPSELLSLGMGKLGGQELNAGSDVDLIFIYDTDDGQSELPLHEHWSRVVRRAVAGMEAPSPDGMIWRVDLRLRPEGSRGAVVNSMAAAERYYETWGRLWERAAMLRARTVAGSAALGATLERELIVPFVYRRDAEPVIATALAELLERSRAELCRSPERDLKLGPGGIREAEFFVQALQLFWGGREPSVRVQGLVPALERLEGRGLVSDREARQLASAYLLLRRVEHHVQWMTGVQTHLLPQGDELGKLARTLGFPSEARLLRDLSRARETVSTLFSGLIPQAPRRPPRHQAVLLQLDQHDAEPMSSREPAFGSPEMMEHLRALGRRPDGLFGARTFERYPDLLDTVLDAIASAPDPEQAARLLRSFFGRFVSPAVYVDALAQHPQALQRFVTALGSSLLVGDAVVGHPDLADVILFGGGKVSDPKESVAAEIETYRRTRGDDPDERRDRFVAALRRAKRRLTIELAALDLAGAIETREVTRALSDLADRVLQLAAEHELGPGAPGLAIIAVGKLGGRDVGYGSDLDILFIYDPAQAPDPDEAPAYFVRRAQRIIRLISEPHPAGGGYELDTRLRPSGSHGMLVTSLASFASYHRIALDDGPERPPKPAVLSSGAAWERQALLRARYAAGDVELGRRVIEVAERAAYEQGAPPVGEMHHLRLRMQHELARERQGHYDLKLGHGGLLDVEFATQWLQMRFGADRRVRTTDTLSALQALRSLGHLPEAEFEVLRSGYTFLRRLEQRMHVLHGTGTTTIDVTQPGLRQLARRMGIQDFPRAAAKDALIDQYLRVTREVRRAYQSVLGVE